jgi:lysozyme family protein
MTAFDEAFAVTVGIEGGYSDNPKDPGNWTGGAVGRGELRGTKFGISAKSYPLVDIKNLTLAGAKLIYRADYWNLLKADSLSPSFSDELFDIAVNQGVGTAIRCLQEVVGVTVDGVMGPLTIAAANAHGGDKVVLGLISLRIVRYTADRNWLEFGKGWANRAAKLLWAQSQAA